MYHSGNIASYGLDYSDLKRLLRTPEDEWPSLRELYGMLLYGYSQSIQDCYFLNFYDLEGGILGLDKDSLEQLYEYYQSNLERIQNELDRIDVPDYYSEAYQMLIEILGCVNEQNEGFFEADWKTIDRAELDRTYESYLELRDAFWDELDRQGALFL